MNPKTNNNLLGSDRRIGNVKRGALGKGLGALIPGKVESRRNYFECPVARIKPAPNQPRRTFDEAALDELAESIARSGIIQPLVVRQDGADYRLIAGERRLRASRKLGLAVVPVVIKDVSPDVAFEMALIENIQREDLNPVEEAEAYQRLMNLRGYTQEAMAESLGKSRSTVANTLRLLNLNEAVQHRIVRGEISSGAARAILALPDQIQPSAAEIAVEQGLTVRQLEAVARRVKAGDNLKQALDAELNEVPPPAPPTRPTGPVQTTLPTTPRQAAPAAPTAEAAQAPEQIAALSDRNALARELMTLFSTRVDFYEDEENPKAGSIEIVFESEADLSRIIHLMRGIKSDG